MGSGRDLVSKAQSEIDRGRHHDVNPWLFYTRTYVNMHEYAMQERKRLELTSNRLAL